MYRWLMLALVLLLLGARAAHADVPGFGPRPRRPMPVHPSNAVPITIQAAKQGESARLLIPRSLLERGKKVAPGERFGALGMPIPLFAFGIISFASLGLLCLRGRRFTRATLVFFAFVAMAGAGASILWANAPPPISSLARPPIDPPAEMGKDCKLDGVHVEITDEGDEVRLLVPVEQLAARRR